MNVSGVYSTMYLRTCINLRIAKTIQDTQDLPLIKPEKYNSILVDYLLLFSYSY